ncbi:hypothetical protein SO802_015735 [Lithocarpus litseifolius]|uniref:Uncharacterized protein n=1 Tax=Lithocarpus litseifolius TaxID=425828 RepID=A0AAW2CVU1_9ROSI
MKEVSATKGLDLDKSNVCDQDIDLGYIYDPTFDWHDKDGLLQEPRTHAPYCHVDTKVWMYEYFRVGHETREEVLGIFPRFLHWLPQYRLLVTSKPSLEIWRLVIDNLSTNDKSLNPWAGCDGYTECEQSMGLNRCQALFECGHGRYWYLGDRVLPEVHHVYPPTTIPVPPYPSIWLVDFLTDEESPPSEGEEKEEIPSPHHASSSSSSFMDTYPHFPAWKYDVMNPDGTDSSMPLNRLMWILWRKACGWLEACSHWLILNPLNICSMIPAGYALLLSGYLSLELCLTVELTPNSAKFSGT